MKSVVIDNSNLFAGGGIQVTTSFLNDLNNLESNYDFHVIQSPNSATAIDKSKFKSNFTFYDLKTETSKSVFKRIINVKKIERLIKPDIIFTVFGPSYHRSKCPKIVGFAIPFMIYPNSPFFDKIGFFEKIKYKMIAFIKKQAFLANSDALVFETLNAQNIFSKSTQNHKLYTVSNTLNEIFLKEDQWKLLKINNTSSFNIVYLTSNYLHKNIQIIPEVIDVLLDKHHLADFRFLISVTKEEMNFPDKYDKYIEYLGKIPLSEIPDLYKQSHLAFIPTLLEVFSATYLEAMHMKIPIVASDLPFSRDICNNAAIFCKPTDPEDYADAIYNLHQNPQLATKFINNGLINIKRFGDSINRTREYLRIIKQTVKK